jgi:hypothetical protein
MMGRLKGLIHVATLSLVMTGCVPNKAYRSCLGAKPGCTVQSVLHETMKTEEFDRSETGAFGFSFPYDLTFVEFDDRGEMFDRRQLAAAVKAIDDAKKRAPQGTTPVVAVFVHGWKNNASDSSGNVWGFRQTLAGLSSQYKIPGGAFAPVVGVYLGWRGAVVSAPIIKEFTFFDRHAKSQNLPGPHMAEALVKIMQAAKGRDFSDANTVSVLIGHSFGGAVLETALSETLADLVVRAQATSTSIKWPADLILFLNEAQEATRSYQLIESLIANVTPRAACVAPTPGAAPAPTVDTGVMLQAPAIISVSSTGDTATRLAFPGAQSLGRAFNSLRKYPDDGNAVGVKSQTSMFFRTTAHMKEFQSHLMRRSEDPEVIEAMKLCRPVIDMDLGGKFLAVGEGGTSPRYVLVERPQSRNRTPYWVFQIPPEVVPDHSTIFTPVFRRFLLSLLRARRSPDGKPIMRAHDQPQVPLTQ